MFGLSVTGTTVILWLLLGLLLAPQAKSREIAKPAMAWGTIGTVLVIAVAGVLFIGNVRYVSADYHYLLARVGGLSPDQRVAETQKAVALNPFNDIYRAEVGLAYSDWAIARLSGQAGDPSTAQQEAFELLQKAEQAHLATIEFVPPEYDNYVFLANLYNTMAEYYDPTYYGRAIGIARRGIDVEPFGPAVRVEYARALLSTEKRAEAIEQLEYSLELDPGYAAAGLLLARAYEEQGDLEKALEMLKAIEARRPGQTGIPETIQRLEASITAQ